MLSEYKSDTESLPAFSAAAFSASLAALSAASLAAFSAASLAALAAASVKEEPKPADAPTKSASNMTTERRLRMACED
jgi:hypothetical protein